MYHHTTLEDKEDPGIPSPLRYGGAGRHLVGPIIPAVTSSAERLKLLKTHTCMTFTHSWNVTFDRNVVTNIVVKEHTESGLCSVS